MTSATSAADGGLAVPTEDERYRFIRAVKDGDYANARSLLERRSNEELLYVQEAPVLDIAVVCCHSDIVELLLEHGADPNARDTLGRSALHLIAGSDAPLTNEREKILQLLADAGANLNAEDTCGDTPLHYAARENCEPYPKLAVAQWLLTRGADVNATNSAMQTPLDLVESTMPNAERLRDLLRSSGGTD